MHIFPNLANTVKIEGSFSLAAQVRLGAPINYGIQSSILQNHVPRLWFLSLRHRKTWAVSEHRRRTRSFAWWYPRCGIPKAVSLHHSLIWIILHQASARTRMRLKFQGYQWNQWTNCENGVQMFNRTVACALMWSKTQIKASGMPESSHSYTQGMTSKPLSGPYLLNGMGRMGRLIRGPHSETPPRSSCLQCASTHELSAPISNVFLTPGPSVFEKIRQSFWDMDWGNGHHPRIFQIQTRISALPAPHRYSSVWYSS